MFDGLPIGDISGWTAAALLSIAICRMVLTDRLVSRKRLEEAQSDRDKALAANDKLLTALNTTTRQTEELLGHARTTNALLSTLARAREGPTE